MDILCRSKNYGQFLFGVMIIEGPQLLDLPAMDGYEQPTPCCRAPAAGDSTCGDVR